MATLTIPARAYLIELLSTSSIKGEPVIRIQRSGEAWVLTQDQVRDGDEVVRHDGQPLFAYSSAHASALENLVVDYREDEFKSYLVLTVPSELG